MPGVAVASPRASLPGAPPPTSLSLPHVTPDALLAALRRPGTVLLDGPRRDADTGRRGALLFAAPSATRTADGYGDVAALLDALDADVAAGRYVAGVLAYEAGYALEPGRFPDPPLPDGRLGWFGVYDAPVEVPPETLDAAFDGLPTARVEAPAFAWDAGAYAERIADVHRHVRAGDVYQINLTAPFRFAFEGDAVALFAALRAGQSASYGAVVREPGRDVLSVSPELFFRVDPADGGARTITARPMKGTAPRGAGGASDRALEAGLLASEKDRAENLMIVDLLRNDLARVAATGSVRVPALFEAERYETLTQMTSTVAADLRAGASLGDVLRALFPCGSVTGAPKIRAMSLIRELEDGPRGVYCGAVGYAAPGAAGGLGEAAFNVAIRTAVVRDGRGRYDVGSGVVWDSVAAAEYAECRLKARVLTDLADG